MKAGGKPFRRDREVAVLGAGIMGCSVALFLARAGFRVTLFDEAASPMSRASRWNEGKIHLGYLYAADPSLATARRVLPGGLAFRRIVEELVGCSIADTISFDDDHYLVHRDSVAKPAAMERYFRSVDAMVAEFVQTQYMTGEKLEPTRALSKRELAELADPARIVGGFKVPERSVRTQVIADRFETAVRAEAGIRLRLGERVVGLDEGGKRRWRVDTASDRGEFDIVVNALWNGRLAIDSRAGIKPEAAWSNRYRVSVFAATGRPIRLPSAVVCTGPFGDIKNYDTRNFYLSWYEAGLLLDSDELDPDIPGLPEDAAIAITRATEAGLASAIPQVREIFQAAETIVVRGGFVFAYGKGALSDRASSLHRRSRFGVVRKDSYFSVDTGKYSTAPWLAWELSREISNG